MARRLHETFQPSVVVGFGGYPALPALLAAHKDGIPTVIPEQNAVLVRVNRLMARKVAAIAPAYPQVERLAVGYAAKPHIIGTPGREEVLPQTHVDKYTLNKARVSPNPVTGGRHDAHNLSKGAPPG